jgi:phage gp45-like
MRYIKEGTTRTAEREVLGNKAMTSAGRDAGAKGECTAQRGYTRTDGESKKEGEVTGGDETGRGARGKGEF